MRKISITLFLILAATLIYPQRIKVESPKEGDTWNIGSPYTIKWQYYGFNDPDNVEVRIRLLRSADMSVAARITNATKGNTFPWTIPGSVSPGTYRMRVRTTDSLFIGDSRIFTVASNLPFIKVQYPIGGERIGVPINLNIQWNSSSDIHNVNILGTDGGPYQMLVVRTPNTKSYHLFIDETLPDGKNYKIKIEDADNPGTFDESDSPFEIYHKNQPYIRIIKPDGHPGERYAFGKPMKIKWECGGFDKKVCIQLWRNNKMKGTIVEKTNKSEIDWNVHVLPDTPGGMMLASTGYQIRVFSVNKPAILVPEALSSQFELYFADNPVDLVVSNCVLTDSLGRQKSSFVKGEMGRVEFEIENGGPGMCTRHSVNVWSVHGKPIAGQLAHRGNTHTFKEFSVLGSGQKKSISMAITINEKKTGQYTLIIKATSVIPSYEPNKKNNACRVYFRIPLQMKSLEIK